MVSQHNVMIKNNVHFVIKGNISANNLHVPPLLLFGWKIGIEYSLWFNFKMLSVFGMRFRTINAYHLVLGAGYTVCHAPMMCG